MSDHITKIPTMDLKFINGILHQKFFFLKPNSGARAEKWVAVPNCTEQDN